MAYVRHSQCVAYVRQSQCVAYVRQVWHLCVRYSQCVTYVRHSQCLASICEISQCVEYVRHSGAWHLYVRHFQWVASIWNIFAGPNIPAKQLCTSHIRKRFLMCGTYMHIIHSVLQRYTSVGDRSSISCDSNATQEVHSTSNAHACFCASLHCLRCNIKFRVLIVLTIRTFTVSIIIITQ